MASPQIMQQRYNQTEKQTKYGVLISNDMF